MKKIRINEMVLPDRSSVYLKQKQYCIFLGNDSRNYFPSSKAAKEYLAKTNRFLNQQLHRLNFSYINLFSEYRQFWFYIEAQQTRNSFKMFRNFEEIENIFVKIIDKSHYVNGNYTTIIDLNRIADLLIENSDMLLKFVTSRKFYLEAQKIDVFKTEILNTKKDIENYGQTDR